MVDILRYIRRLTRQDRLHAVLGGFRLSGPAVEPTCDALGDLAPDVLIPALHRLADDARAGLPGSPAPSSRTASAGAEVRCSPDAAAGRRPVRALPLPDQVGESLRRRISPRRAAAAHGQGRRVPAGQRARPVRKMPGAAGYEPIWLEHGVTHDAEFEQWANAAWAQAAGPTFVAVWRTVSLDVFDRAGRRALSYLVVRAWVSEYEERPQPGADPGAVAIARVKVENEGWQHDTS
jgi:phage tail-like protein